MKNVSDLLLRRPLLATAGFIAVSTLVWFLGPLLAIGDFRPLASDAARWLAITLWSAAAMAYVLTRATRSARSNRRLMESLVGGAGPATVAAPGARDLAAIGKRFEDAVQLLKQARLGGGNRWLAALAGRPYVYQLPWYVIIGAPGAGKTTALVNSGLEFPLASKLGKKAVRGIGGTRNCDWWFAADAVLIDTAGRFTTQDSDREADRAAWMGFLDLLRQYRPRRPLNGVLLTISVSDLLNANAEERQAHARKLRDRVDELQARLGRGIPIYVLVTKVDLLAGFMEFFADFDKEERAQVWGVTFPYVQNGTPVEGAQEPQARAANELIALEKRLDECLFERLHGETDRERRAAIYAFPQQWRVLRETLVDFLQATFAPRVDRKAAALPLPPGGTHLVRGVYFTSATQEGTPMDRALGELGRALGLSRRIVVPARPSGKTFFVTRLLRDVVFAEAGLVGANLAWDRNRVLLKWGVVGATVGAVVLVGALTWRAYFDNRAYVTTVATRLPALEKGTLAVRQAPADDLAALLPILDQLHAEAEAPRAAPGVVPTMGLDQRAKLGSAAHDVYYRVLRNVFLPRIAARLEDRLRADETKHVELIYEALKAYLMLFGGRNFDAAALRAYVSADWEATLPPSVKPTERAALQQHLDRLLASGEVGAPALADRKLIDKARVVVARVPLAQRVYNRLKGHDLGPPLAVFAGQLPAAQKVFTRASGLPLAQGVPLLYSRDIYRQWLRKYSTDVLHQFASESTWVLGTKTPVVTDPTTEARVLNEVEQFYLADYGRVWEGLLEDIRVAPTANLAQTAEVAQGLARPDSPLVTLLNAVVREVSLTPAATGGDGAPRTGAEALQALDGKFAPLREFAANRTGLQETQALLGKLATHLAMVDDAVKRKTPAPASDIASDLAAQAARTPPPVRGMLTQLAAVGSTELVAATREQLGRQFASEVGAVCKRIEGRYPLARSSSDDISREEFSRTFATGGLIDGFFQRHLAPYVDVSTRPWTFVRLGAAETQGAQATKTEHADALLPFQRAQSIRDAFFRDGGRALGVRLEFRLLEMDAGVSAFALEVDGQNMRFTRDLKQAQSVQWPGPGSTGRVHLRVASGTRGEGSGYVFEGPWALFRMIERVRVEPGASLDRVQLLMDVEGRRARFEVRSATPINPIRLLIQEQFQCPQRL